MDSIKYRCLHLQYHFNSTSKPELLCQSFLEAKISPTKYYVNKSRAKVRVNPGFNLPMGTIDHLFSNPMIVLLRKSANPTFDCADIATDIYHWCQCFCSDIPFYYYHYNQEFDMLLFKEIHYKDLVNRIVLVNAQRHRTSGITYQFQFLALANLPFKAPEEIIEYGSKLMLKVCHQNIPGTIVTFVKKSQLES